MTDLNRRDFLTAAAVGAAAALAPSAHAAAPSAGTQAPGYYRYKVGSFEVTVVTDGAATFPLPDKWVQNHAKAEVQKVLAEAHQATEKVTVPFTPIVINTGPSLCSSTPAMARR